MVQRNIFFAFLAVTLLCSCATMNGSRNQHIAISAFYHNRQVDNAVCSITNDKGRWEVITQGALKVQRSSGDMEVVCEKDGYQTGRATVKSSITSNVWANFMAGGVVGSSIDAASEALYDYPSHIIIYMGQSQQLPEGKIN